MLRDIFCRTERVTGLKMTKGNVFTVNILGVGSKEESV